MACSAALAAVLKEAAMLRFSSTVATAAGVRQLFLCSESLMTESAAFSSFSRLLLMASSCANKTILLLVAAIFASSVVTIRLAGRIEAVGCRL